MSRARRGRATAAAPAAGGGSLAAFTRWRTLEGPRGWAYYLPGCSWHEGRHGRGHAAGGEIRGYSLGRWPWSCIPYCFVPSSRGWDGIIRPAPAGRHPSPSRPAGRTRPSGPGPLYTVRRDHGGHGGHGAPDVTGDARPMVTSALLQDARGRAARAGPGGVDCAAADALFATVPPVPREDVCGVESLRPGPGGDVIVRHGFLMGESPSPKATVYGPSGHSRCTQASGPGFDGGRARSGARSTASVFCAGVLCGSCVAPLLPGGPASLAARARSSRGAATVHRRGPAGRA